MGRPSAGARVWLDEATDKYFIRDRVDGKDVKFSLGFGKGAPNFERRKEEELAKYIAQKHAGEKQRIKNQDASDVLVSEVITKYIDVRINRWELYDEYDNAPSRVGELKSRLNVLLDFFGGMSVDSIDHDAVGDFVEFLDERTYQRKLKIAERKYERAKKKRGWRPENDTGIEPVERTYNPKAAIRYLDDLNAAISISVKTKLLKSGNVVPTPGDYKPRTAVLTRKQVADLIRAARRRRGHAFINGKPTANVAIWEHLARFILIAVYTGSRKDKVWRISYRNERDCPWIEFKGKDPAYNATFHRIGDKEVEHKKKLAPTIPVPVRLAAHMERWKRMGLKYPCQGPDGHAGAPRTGMENLFKEVLGEDHDVVIHTLRHTAATWLVSRAELPMAAIASYLGMSVETLVRRYAKVRKVDHIRVGKAISQSRAGSDHEIDADSSDFVGGRFVPSSASKGLTDTDRNKSVRNVSESAGNQNNAMKTEDGPGNAAA